MTLLTTALAGEKLRIRIWETAEKSFIGLARPWLIRREGAAKTAVDYQNKLALAQAEADLEEVKAGRVRYDPAAGKLVPLIRPLPTQPQLSPLTGSTQPVPLPQENMGGAIPRLGSALDFATHTLLQTAVKEMERTINLERILQHAETEAQDVPDTDVSDALPSGDWISRWREGAQDVKAEQVQLIWARLLTEEIRKPGSFSLRTLDFIRSVSVEEAKLIEKVSALAINKSFVFNDEKLLGARGLVLPQMLDLQAIGVISGAEGGLSWHITTQSAPAAGVFVHYDFGIRWAGVSKNIDVPCFVLTGLGVELLTLGKYKGDREYIRALAKFLGKAGLRCGLGHFVRDNSAIRIVEAEWYGPIDVTESAS